jgi:plasmid stabilization system protein ParE
MKKRRVIIAPEAEADINDIKDIIVSISQSERIAQSYVDGLQAELTKLSFYGSSISPYTLKSITDRYGISVRRTNYKKLAIFFYVESDCVIVRKIVFSHTVGGV